MRNVLGALLCVVGLASAGSAHEFWIEPGDFFAARGATIQATVRVGQGMDGKAFPFEPRAYQIALWVGPDTARDLTRAPLQKGDVSLKALGDGLHTLAVTSYGQLLIYPTLAEFDEFTTSIKLPELTDRHIADGLPETDIRERYRRLSKTLINFGTQTGTDRRIGLEREWVADKGRFTLFDGAEPVPDREVVLQCRQGETITALTRQALTTDATGAVAPNLPDGAQCLLNTVFLERATGDVVWKSDWVSLYFNTGIFAAG